ncbi:hypothetical protein SDC9_101145 [bioreactor metagenome]|uniref:Uncharacterized protein n=1 Tax=bioreactor metagenome TaxID=1076179 RepID=A0A645AMU2_9ZZZZ
MLSGFVVAGADQVVGEVLLGCNSVRIVVRVPVSDSVAVFAGGRVVRVTQMRWHISDPAGSHIGDRRIDGLDHRIRLRSGRRRDGGLSQVEPGLRHADQLDGLGGSDAGLQHRRRGHPDILAGQDDQAPGDEPGILTRLDHPGEPVQRGVHIGTPHRLDESTCHVVVLITVGVVADRCPVDGLLDGFQVDHGGALGVGAAGGLLQVGEYAPRVAACHRQHRLTGGRVELVPLAQASRVGQRPVDQGVQVVVGEWTQGQHQRTREQRRDHTEAGVLGGGGDERDQPVFHRRQQDVLLGLVEAVHLVDEQHGRHTPGQFAFGSLQVGAHLFDPRGHRRDLDEASSGLVGDHRGDGGLADPRWPPQEDRHGTGALGEATQRRARGQQMLLADDLVDAARTHPHRQRQVRVIGVGQRPAGGGFRDRADVAEQVLAHPSEATPWHRRADLSAESLSRAASLRGRPGRPPSSR